MRHSLANLLYRMARAVDRPVVRTDFGFSLGERSRDSLVGQVTATLHGRDDTGVESTFKPPEYGYVYSVLNVGGMTIFMTRLLTIRMIDSLEHLEQCYQRYGEGKAR